MSENEENKNIHFKVDEKQIVLGYFELYMNTVLTSLFIEILKGIENKQAFFELIKENWKKNIKKNINDNVNKQAEILQNKVFSDFINEFINVPDMEEIRLFLNERYKEAESLVDSYNKMIMDSIE